MNLRKAYRFAGRARCGAQLHLAVQEQVGVLPSELEHVVGEHVGRSHAVVLHPHRVVSRVPASAPKQENRSDDSG